MSGKISTEIFPSFDIESQSETNAQGLRHFCRKISSRFGFALPLFHILRLRHPLELHLVGTAGRILVISNGRKLRESAAQSVVTVFAFAPGTSAIEAALELEPLAVQHLGGEGDFVALNRRLVEKLIEERPAIALQIAQA